MEPSSPPEMNKMQAQRARVQTSRHTISLHNMILSRETPHQHHLAVCFPFEWGNHTRLHSTSRVFDAQKNGEHVLPYPVPQVYNHVNCTELKNYKYPECMGKAHEGNVRALIFVENHTLLISASADRSISIHDDSKVNYGIDDRSMCYMVSPIHGGDVSRETIPCSCPTECAPTTFSETNFRRSTDRCAPLQHKNGCRHQAPSFCPNGPKPLPPVAPIATADQRNSHTSLRGRRRMPPQPPNPPLLGVALTHPWRAAKPRCAAAADHECLLVGDNGPSVQLPLGSHRLWQHGRFHSGTTVYVVAHCYRRNNVRRKARSFFRLDKNQTNAAWWYWCFDR